MSQCNVYGQPCDNDWRERLKQNFKRHSIDQKALYHKVIYTRLHSNKHFSSFTHAIMIITEEKDRLEADIEEARQILLSRPKTSTQGPTHPSLPPLPDLFQSRPLLAQALSRVAGGNVAGLTAPSDGIDLSKYNVASTANLDTASAEAALKQSQALLEHQAIRSSNVELLQKYGANTWRISNFLLEQDVSRIERELETINNLSEDLNRRRKNGQTAAGQQLNSLESRWTSLISGNIQLAVACLQAENELEMLKEQERALVAQLQE